MERIIDRRNWKLRTWLRARGAELREDVRGARRDFDENDLRRKAAEATARSELDYIDRALETLDSGLVFEKS